MAIDNVKTETSESSNTFLRLKKRKTLDDASELTLMVEPSTKTATSSGKVGGYKGVLQQKNGRWGAQIYADQERIWLGTFKSEPEAAAAYDSASIKVRSFDSNSHRNFPWTDMTVHEPEFQKCYTKDAVLSMIKDGSYPHKFREFLRIRSQLRASINIGESKHVRGRSNKCFTCTQLFQKELTPSDVGKLNRLVIPKKFAVKYLPVINNAREEEEIAGDVEVVLYDRAMRQWKFRYCYWRSSQSFVFTRGWNSFVKEKNLKEKDVIVFYTCDVPNNMKTLEGQGKKFLMIDVLNFSDKTYVVPEEVNKRVNENFDDEMKTEHFVGLKLKDGETKVEEKSEGFKLFGVRIQCS